MSQKGDKTYSQQSDKPEIAVPGGDFVRYVVVPGEIESSSDEHDSFSSEQSSEGISWNDRTSDSRPDTVDSKPTRLSTYAKTKELSNTAPLTAQSSQIQDADSYTDKERIDVQQKCHKYCKDRLPFPPLLPSEEIIKALFPETVIYLNQFGRVIGNLSYK
uniref:Uncharacterized protein n=1 Tax=Arion vulgaris TaxID=1028688 RepID=A0A0B7AK79_9EUPU